MKRDENLGWESNLCEVELGGLEITVQKIGRPDISDKYIEDKYSEVYANSSKVESKYEELSF